MGSLTGIMGRCVDCHCDEVDIVLYEGGIEASSWRTTLSQSSDVVSRS